MTAMNLIYADINVLDDNTISSDDAVRLENYLCRVARKTMIPAHLKAPVLVSCQGVGFMMNEIHCNIV